MARARRVLYLVLTALAVATSAAQSAPADKTDSVSQQSIAKLVGQVQRADYEGDRPALHRLYTELAPFNDDKTFGSRVRYWRGFALWRSALNGFNEPTTDPKDLEADLKQAVSEFQEAMAKDPNFVDAKIAALSSVGYMIYINRGYPARTQELMAQAGPLLKESVAADPDNPRLLWVLGPIRWSIPAERGGGQDKAIAGYEKGLEVLRAHKTDTADSLDPSWGEPELLMNLAWSNLNRNTPDLKAAEEDAHAALEIVPYWHYVRDILMPQIRDAEAKAAEPPKPAPH